jgi:hypothetical protein
MLVVWWTKWIGIKAATVSSCRWDIVAKAPSATMFEPVMPGWQLGHLVGPGGRISSCLSSVDELLQCTALTAWIVPCREIICMSLSYHLQCRTVALRLLQEQSSNEASSVRKRISVRHIRSAKVRYPGPLPSCRLSTFNFVSFNNQSVLCTCHRHGYPCSSTATDAHSSGTNDQRQLSGPVTSVTNYLGMSSRSEDGQDGYGTGITRVSKACG